MEDDDEFGDLYTDVLRPFSSSLSSAPSPYDAPPSPRPPIDLNLSTDTNLNNEGDVHEDDNKILFAVRDQNSAGEPRVLPSPDAKLQNRAPNPDDLPDKDINFGIEEGNTATVQHSSAMPTMIPGLADGSSRRGEADVSSGPARDGEQWEEEEEEDSDSEDDLQIVLNDSANNNHAGPMLVGGGEDDDDDEDEDPLVIVADGDPSQGMEEQDWGAGEDAAAGAALGAVGPEGERKEGGEGATVGAIGKGNAAVGPKVGYSNHGYHHPFHSQFKYVRPGATPMPGAATAGPGGAPGQLRPPINMGPLAGRGRGEWRPAGIKGGPPMQKNFHPGFGMPAWGSNTSGRGFGAGLEFTLPSHKTIFDVDIDGFEEKPWKYPGADISDFFNFGLNEESWKDYCKQLEQHRLETTMQSKIRVYESGRAEKEYDPDLPPELAAATSAHEVPVDNSNSGKSDIGQIDLTKGSVRMRPPIPTGRAIQVEGGYGERLPSIDTRPPRIRDSDAIIEIVLQESLDDDSSTGNGFVDGENNNPPRDEVRGGHLAEDGMPKREAEYFDDFPQSQNSRKGGRRTPYINSVRSSIPEEDEMLPLHSEASAQYRPGSRDQPSSCSGGDYPTSRKERLAQDRTRDRSPHLTPNQGKRDKRFTDNAEEESVESMDSKHSPLQSSPATVRDVRELSNDDNVPDEPVHAEGSSGIERDEMTENEVAMDDTFADGSEHNFSKKHKINSLVEQPSLQELDDVEDSKAARSSENSKARSGSSKDYQKWQDGVDEEVVQDGRSARSGSMKRQFDDNEQNFRRKDRDVRHDMERNRMVIRGKEGSYPHRDMDPSLSQHFHMKNEAYDRRKERENIDGSWQRRDEDPHGRKSRNDDRKRERVDEIGSRHGSKTRENERADKDEHLHSRKQLDNGNYRVHHDKDGSSRHREREGSLKSRHEIVDDYHSKRRKDEEYLRRDHGDKEDVLLGHRETTSRRRRERDDVLDPRKRDDQQRSRDNLDDYHSVRHKDDVWLQRERGERQREEFYRLKQSHEETLSKREREEGRSSMRSGRVDDKTWVGHTRVKDEYKVSEKDYQLKDAARSSEHQKRRERMEDESISHHRGRDDVHSRVNQFGNDERRSRQERSGTRIDRPVDTPDNQRVHEKKHKENIRKSKDSDGRDCTTSGASRRGQDEQVTRTDEMGLRRTSEPGNAVNEAQVQHNSSKRHKEDASSDDEQQDSKRGRSKLERWTSHKERDYSISNKASATLKFKENDRNNNGGSSEAGRFPNEPPKKLEVAEKHPTGEDKDAGDTENKDTDAKPLEDRHLDTVEKLKKRSERFKLPLPSEKDTLAIKKMESEALPSIKTEVPPDTEVKPERPARKRRWISN